MLKQFEVNNIYIGEYVPPKTFTITWTEKSDMSSWWTYSDDAAGLTAGSSDFDDFFWYYGCRLSNAGAETATVKQSSPWTLDITQLGTLTSWDNVMIAFPRRWIKMTKSWTTVTLSITEEPNKGWYQYYAHTKWSDAKNTLYLWAYKMVSWYKSLSWASPLGGLTRDEFRQWIKSAYDSLAWTNKYSQISIYARWYINALYMMKYGNPNSQSVIWYWNVWGTLLSTWWTNSQTSASYWTSSQTDQIKLFWLEDWWWNTCEFLDCCWIASSSHLTVDKTNSVFQDSDCSTDLWVASSWWLGWIDGSNDGMFRNVNTNWSATTYYTDYSSATSSRVPVAAYRSGYPTRLGAFSMTLAYPTTSGATYWARLMYL